MQSFAGSPGNAHGVLEVMLMPSIPTKVVWVASKSNKANGRHSALCMYSVYPEVSGLRSGEEHHAHIR